MQIIAVVFNNHRVLSDRQVMAHFTNSEAAVEFAQKRIAKYEAGKNVSELLPPKIVDIFSPEYDYANFYPRIEFVSSHRGCPCSFTFEPVYVHEVCPI